MAYAEETPVGRWKIRHGYTYDEAAEELDVKVDYLRKIGAGMNRPGPDLALQIQRRSRGQISAVELVFGTKKPK